MEIDVIDLPRPPRELYDEARRIGTALGMQIQDVYEEALREWIAKRRSLVPVSTEAESK